MHLSESILSNKMNNVPYFAIFRKAANQASLFSFLEVNLFYQLTNVENFLQILSLSKNF